MTSRTAAQPPPDLKDPQLQSIPPAFTGGGIVGSFRAALAGVLRTVASQRNMKVHVVAAMMVMIVGMALPLDIATRTALLFAVALVFFAEILNTALEAFVDLHVQEYHRLAMLAKDAAAAGVLVLAAFAVLAFLEVLYLQWDVVAQHSDDVMRAVVFGVPLCALEIAGLFVVRRRLLAVVRLMLSLALAVPLVHASRDPIFAAVFIGLIATAFLARWIFDRPHVAA